MFSQSDKALISELNNLEDVDERPIAVKRKLSVNHPEKVIHDHRKKLLKMQKGSSKSSSKIGLSYSDQSYIQHLKNLTDIQMKPANVKGQMTLNHSYAQIKEIKEKNRLHKMKSIVFF